ncbi:MAG: c-type cytochrome [Gemmatimonadota bacterium]|nr:c-type cytochrome [Gemmatimonadota bacterium]
MHHRIPKLVARSAVVAIAVVALGARAPEGDARSPAARPASSPPPARVAQAAPQFTPGQLALGDSIFRGKAAGGLCFTCHQPNAKGLPGIAPDLTDDKWLHGDGSYEFIVATVTKGVPKPKQAVAPMLPKGGAGLSEAQVRAVAAYVYSLRNAKR